MDDMQKELNQSAIIHGKSREASILDLIGHRLRQ